MADKTPNVDSLFMAALEIDSPEQRKTFLRQSCGDNKELLAELTEMMSAQGEIGSFLEQPAPGLEDTFVSDASGKDLAASLDAGLALSFDAEAAVVIGDANHSVLRSLGNTLNEVPRVALRESVAEGPDPIARPSSPEIPKSDSDSRYQLQGEIARGGMGAIIKGRDIDLGRDLAIKVLLDSHKDKPEVIQRFIEEAQIGGQLQHPGIAPIYELGQFADQRPFFAMKLVKGQTLSKLLADREDAADERGRFIGIFEQICQTMAYAHSRGVIHRDLKPANIMVGAFGEVQVMDWGLAKVLPAGGVADEKNAYDKQQGQSIIQTLRSQPGSDAAGTFGTLGSQTQMGSVMGTPAYMPPEQALGEIDNMDERADVFGLGAILCEILTGKPPYVADDGTRVFRMASRGMLDDAFSRLKGCGADEHLIALTKDCLELEPVDRPRDAGVLADRVTGYLESVEAKLREAEVERAAEAARADAEAAKVAAETERAEAESARATEESRRRRVSLALAASILLLFGIGGGSLLYVTTAEAAAERKYAFEMQSLAEERDVERKTAMSALAEAQNAESRARLAERETEQELYISDMIAAHDAVKGNNVRRAVKLLLKYGPEKQSRDLRKWDWYFLWGLCSRAFEAQWIPQNDCALSVEFAPDGTSLAVGRPDGVFIHRPASRDWKITKSLERSGWNGTFARYSSNRGILAYQTNEEDGLTFVQGLGSRSFPAGRPFAFSQSGKYFAARHQGKLVVCDTDKSWESSQLNILKSISFREQLVDVFGGWQENNLSFSPDDSQIAVGFSDGQVKVWDWRGEAAALVVGKRNARVPALLFGHDGSTVIAGYSDAKVVVWDVKSRTVRQQIDLHKDEIRGLAYSEQAGLYAVASRDNSISLWDSKSFEWIETLRGHSGICQAVAFSPNGKLLASASQDYTVGIWPIARKRFSLQMMQDLGSSRFDERSLVHNRRVYSVDSGVLMHRDLNSSTYGEPTVVARDVASFSMSREGILVIGTTDGQVRIQGHPEIGQNFSFKTSLPEISTIECHCSSSLLQIACTGPQGEMQCWELTDSLAPKLCFTKRLQAPSKFRDENQPLKFSVDGKLLVCEGNEYTANVYDWNSGVRLHSLHGHRDAILAIAITDDAGKIATGSFDNTLRIWDLSKEDVPSCLLTGHSASVRAVQFLDGGSTLVSGAGDRTLKFWDLSSYRERLTIDTGGVVYGVEIADVDELEILSLGEWNKVFKRPSEQDVEAAIPRVTRYLDALEAR